MKFIAVVIFALGLASCISSGTAVDQNKVATFQKGQTTYTDVVQALGAPNQQLTSDDGTRMITYSHILASPRAQDFIPYVGPFISKSDVTTDTYTFTFDTAGLLKSVASGTAQSTTSFGLAN